MSDGDSYKGYGAWKGWSEEDFGRYTAVDAVYFDAELRRAGVSLRRPLRILELGFGNGAFAGWARDRGHQYWGTELIDSLLQRATTAGVTALDGSADLIRELGAGALDLIVAWDVLEHRTVAELELDLDVFRRLLKSDGLLIARVPSGDSPFGRGIFHGDITHRVALGSYAVRQLAQRAGFGVKLIAPPALPVTGVGVRRGLRRMGIRAARTIISRILNVVFHDNEPLVITSNLVFVLKKL